jgi:hypothetical protein
MASAKVSIFISPRFLDGFVEERRGNKRTTKVVWMINTDASRGATSVAAGSCSKAVHVSRSSTIGLSALNSVTHILATGDVNSRVVFRRFDGVLEGMVRGPWKRR